MPFIKFVRDYTVQADDGPTYKVGQVVECSEASAGHFINRQAAVECESPSAEPEAERPKQTQRKTKRQAKVTDESD